MQGRSLYAGREISVDDTVNRLAKELADAMADAVASDPRVEACRALLESVEALYAVLSDRQRRMADRLLSPILKDVLTASSDMHSRRMAA